MDPRERKTADADDDKGEYYIGSEDEDDGLPFVCLKCKDSFVNPVVTRYAPLVTRLILFDCLQMFSFLLVILLLGASIISARDVQWIISRKTSAASFAKSQLREALKSPLKSSRK